MPYFVEIIRYFVEDQVVYEFRVAHWVH